MYILTIRLDRTTGTKLIDRMPDFGRFLANRAEVKMFEDQRSTGYKVRIEERPERRRGAKARASPHTTAAIVLIEHPSFSRSQADQTDEHSDIASRRSDSAVGSKCSTARAADLPSWKAVRSGAPWPVVTKVRARKLRVAFHDHRRSH
jgi:hypothetical protein